MSKKDKTKSGLPHFDGKDRSTFKPFATVATDVLQKRKRKFEDSKNKKGTQMTEIDGHNYSATTESPVGQRELESRLRLIGVLSEMLQDQTLDATNTKSADAIASYIADTYGIDMPQKGLGKGTVVKALSAAKKRLNEDGIT